jgi:hypothetical protein
MLMIGLSLPSTTDERKQDEIYRTAKEIERLLDENIVGVSFQVVS